MAGTLTPRSPPAGPAGGASGDRAEAIRLLEPALQANATFPERIRAERRLAERKAAR